MIDAADTSPLYQAVTLVRASQTIYLLHVAIPLSSHELKSAKPFSNFHGLSDQKRKTTVNSETRSGGAMANKLN